MAFQKGVNFKQSIQNTTKYHQLYSIFETIYDDLLHHLFYPSLGSFILQIINGIFLGDKRSPQFLDFINNNKITTIINCSGPQVTTSHLPDTIKLLSIPWKDSDQQLILSITNLKQIQAIFSLIEQTHQKLQTVLICSLRGQSRSLTILIAYLMKKYKWSLYKTIQYLNSKRKNFEIRANFFNQLKWYEDFLFGKDPKACTRNWNLKESTEEATLVRNTFLNSFLVKQNLEPNSFHKKKNLNNKRATFIFGVFRENSCQKQKIQQSSPELIWKQKYKNCKDLQSKQDYRNENNKEIYLKNNITFKQIQPFNDSQGPGSMQKNERLMKSQVQFKDQIVADAKFTSTFSHSQYMLASETNQMQKSRFQRLVLTPKNKLKQFQISEISDKVVMQKKMISPYSIKARLNTSISRAENERSRSFSIKKPIKKLRTLQK